MKYVKLPKGTRIVDTSGTITPSDAAELRAAGIWGAIRTVGNTIENLTAAEWRAWAPHLGLVGAYGMYPKPEQVSVQGGADAGKAHRAEARAAEVPDGLVLACDAEGSGSAAAWEAYMRAWLAEQKGSLLVSVAYDGVVEASEVAPATKDAMGFAAWWTAKAWGAKPPTRGYALEQSEDNVKIGRGVYDVNTVLVDDVLVMAVDDAWTPPEAKPAPAPPPAPVPAPTPAPAPAGPYTSGPIARTGDDWLKPSRWASAPAWLQALCALRPGERRGQRLSRIRRHFTGVSLHVRRAELDALAQLVDERPDPDTWTTNCATFERWILAAAGETDHYARDPDVIGTSMGWDIQIGYDHQAVIACTHGDEWKRVDAGWLIHYATPGHNDDHMEMADGRPGPSGVAPHGGGGRGDNAITEGTGDIRTSWGRPIAHLIDPDKLAIPYLPADIVVPPPVAPPPVVAPPPQPAPVAPPAPPSGPAPAAHALQALLTVLASLAAATGHHAAMIAGGAVLLVIAIVVLVSWRQRIAAKAVADAQANAPPVAPASVGDVEAAADALAKARAMTPSS